MPERFLRTDIEHVTARSADGRTFNLLKETEVYEVVTSSGTSINKHRAKYKWQGKPVGDNRDGTLTIFDPTFDEDELKVVLLENLDE